MPRGRSRRRSGAPRRSATWRDFASATTSRSPEQRALLTAALRSSRALPPLRRPPDPSGTRTTAGPMPGFPATHRARRAGGSTPAARRRWPVPRSRSPDPTPCRARLAPATTSTSSSGVPPQTARRRYRPSPRKRRRCFPPRAPLRRAPAPRRPAPGRLAAPPRRCRSRPPVPHAPFSRRHLGRPKPRPPRSGPSTTSVPRGAAPARPTPPPGRGARRGPAGKGAAAAGERRERPRARLPPTPPRLPRALPPPRTHLPIAMCRRRVCHQICSGNRSPSHVSSHLPRPPPPAGPSGPVPRGRTREARWETPLVSFRGGEELPLPRAVPAGHLFAPRWVRTQPGRSGLLGPPGHRV